MQNLKTQKYLAAIVDYLLKENSCPTQCPSCHNMCLVLSCSPNKKYWLLLDERTIKLFILETHENLEIVSNIKPTDKKDEPIIEYWHTGGVSLVENVIWNQGEMTVSFTQYYTSPWSEYGVLIDCDFSTSSVKVRERKSIIKHIKTQQKLTLGQHVVPDEW